MSATMRRTPGPTDTMKSRKNDSIVDKLTGTLTRKKKSVHENQEPPEEDEALEIEIEGRESIDACLVPAMAKNLTLDEGEVRRYLTKESSEDRKVRELISLLTYWINEELAEQRIVVRNLQEDIFDGQILQILIEKLAGIRIEVPELTQSEEGQKKKLELVVQAVNRIVTPTEQPRWDAELIHSKDIVAIMQILIAMVLHFRAPIRLPEHVSVKMLVASKQQGHSRSEFVTEQLTTTQPELGLKGERDAFDTLFDYGPDKLAHVKTSLLAFCNKHLNKINLEVNDLETQFQDGVFLVLLMGLLEGYFVPLHAFHLQVTSYEEKVKNVGFAFKLMHDAGLPKPRSRIQDIANGDLKSTLRLLHLLFTKYKHV
ncbi:hypothetical protein RB195_000023 [Necator americanus]|uniref:Uncharacterized protein n=2 Tax=Necator americanus TaxID=51031 RepID=W2T4F6_NECAM|nr:hypothetical protein NECAME_00435 [Necator americanus]ETN76910.1 hypothetical protein NECAME_00435 [Necator americanus]